MTREFSLLGILCFFFLPMIHGHATDAGQGGPLDGSVALSCFQQSDSVNVLKCSLKNASDSHLIYLKAPLVLEGPAGSEGYFYKNTGGTRYENTFEYGPSEIGRLGGGILFTPDVDLRSEEIKQLRIVPGDSEYQLLVNYSNASGLATDQKLLVQPKLIVARLDAALEFLKANPRCSKVINMPAETVGDQPGQLEVVEFPSGVRYSNLPCYQEFSRLFQHVFSEPVLALFRHGREADND